MRFIDQFPCEIGSPMYAAHAAIDSELRSSSGRPAIAALSAGASWLSAAMERVEWNAGRGPDGHRWIGPLRALLRLSVMHPRTIGDEPTLLRMVRYGALLHDKNGAGHCHGLPELVAQTITARKAPLTGELATALVPFVEHLVAVHDHSPGTFALAFRLFREGYSTIPWFHLPPPDNAPWKQLLDLAQHGWQSTGLDPKHAARLAAAIGKVGPEEVAAVFARAVTRLESLQPAYLSGAGMTMLRQMLLWTLARPELPVDDTLYRLCAVRWQQQATNLGLQQEWIGTLLQVLAKRDPDRAFACVECLAHNPGAKDFREVASLYEQYLAQFTRHEAAPTKGIDGFPLASGEHRILDDFLRASIPRPYEAGFHTAVAAKDKHVELAVRQSQSDHPAMLRAMHERVRWLAAQEPPLQSGQGRPTPYLFWCCDLGKLYIRILQANPALDASALAALCQIDSLNWLGIAPTSALFASCEQWIAANAFVPELSAAMVQWQKSQHGSIAAMTLRKQIGWLLWFDTAAPVNEKNCWSAFIRKDLRAMPPAQRGPWIALLRNANFSSAERPTKKWLKPAESLIKNIPPADFRRFIRSWFEPFRPAGQKLKITIPGRDILGSLFWYALLAKDPQVDEAVLWFGSATWKSQADLDRTARLLPIWIYTIIERSPAQARAAIEAYAGTGQLSLTGKSLEMYQTLCARDGSPPRIAASPPSPPLDPNSALQTAMAKAFSTVMGDAARIAGDTLRVTNETSGQHYEIGLRDGRIRRCSDGKLVRIEIDWSQPPFSQFQQLVDGGDLANPFGPNYSRLMLCAQVLSGALPIHVPIVVDEG